MVTISLCMIVKNEEAVLERCLNGVKDLADEIVIVDTGSEDRTKEIAGEFTDRIYDFPWSDDFSAARNASFEKARMDYCMWLDADDVILEKDRALLRELKNSMSGEEDVVMLPYHTAFDEEGKPVFVYYRERLVKNHAGFAWEGEIHEVITPRGNILYGEPAITHKKMKPGDSGRNLRILEKKKQSGQELPPRQKFYYGQELYFNGRYLEAIRVLREFLADPEGWLENKLEACKTLSFCYRETGREDLAAEALIKSLLLDVPRAELCCQIGEHFFRQGSYEQAAFWYETARTRKEDARAGGFVQPECYGYIPNIQLAVCYDRLGMWEQANACNERAAVFKPHSEAVIRNRVYFENKLKEI